VRNVSDEVILKILRRSPQGFTPFEILDQVLAQPQYQECRRSSIFSELLPVLQSLRDSQVVAHVSPRWVLAETRGHDLEGFSNEPKDTDKSYSFQELLEQTTIESLVKSQDNTKTFTIKTNSNTHNKEAQSHTQLEINFSAESYNYINNANIDFPIERLNLSLRAYNCLTKNGINTVRELQNCSDEVLLSIKNFGQTSLAEVRSKLANFKLPSQPLQIKGVILPEPIQPKEIPLLPEWASLPGMQFSIRDLAVSISLYQIISKYQTVAQLIYEFEADRIVLDSQQKTEIQFRITPFQALRDAYQSYIEWLASLSKSILKEVLIKLKWTPEKLKELSPCQILSMIPSNHSGYYREITHQAIISAKIPSKKFNTIAEEIDDCLYLLKEQQKFVLKQRIGLQNGKIRSLENIGKELQKTRERVRQIESTAQKKLIGIYNKNILLQLRKVAIETLRAAGCISTLEEWCKAIAQKYSPGEIHLPSVILWMIDYISEIYKLEIHNNIFFYIAPLTRNIFSDVQAQIKEFWKEQKFSNISLLYQIILPQLPEDILNPEQVADILINSLCYEPLPGIFSAEEWNIPDYAYYVLYEAGKSLHFSEIGQRIKKLKPDWKAENLERSAQGAIDRHPEIIRCGSGIYGLREWGTMEYRHFREVLLDYLSKQLLPVDAEDIYAELSQSYAVTRPTITMNLSFHPHLFNKFGRSNFYGVAGRRYDLPDENLLNLLVAKFEAGPISLSELERDSDLSEYDLKTIYLYLNVSPLFCQMASMNERKFALSIEGKRQYEPGDSSKIVADIFNQIREPLHAKDFMLLTRNYYAYAPGESAFWRTLSEDKNYINITEAIFIPRDWMNGEALSLILEELDAELFRDITIFTIGSKRQQPSDDVLFDWLDFCYRKRFFYRGSLVYAQINLSELSDQKAQKARQIGKVCQRNGDTSVLAIGQDSNGEEVDRTLRLELEELRQQAQSRQRTPSKGLASKPDGNYRVRYVTFGVEVHLTKWGGTDNPCAKVLKIMVNNEAFDPSRHNLIPTNTATIDKRQEALKKLYEATLTAYGQVDPYLQVAIGLRPSWGVGYRNMEPITEPTTGDLR
jgi:Bacterial RNA polymerase, alpha chain C terminal domain/Sigma-70, region 4